MRYHVSVLKSTNNPRVGAHTKHMHARTHEAHMHARTHQAHTHCLYYIICTVIF